MAAILIVEDDPTLREVLEMQIEDMQHRPIAVGTIGEAREQLDAACPDLMLLDQQLPDGTGLELLREIHEHPCTPPVIMITGVRDTDLAIEAMKEGAYDFIRKPMDIDELSTAIGNVLNSSRTNRRVGGDQGDPESTGSQSTPDIIGDSPSIIAIAKTIGRVAVTNATVLITGESGTGKEVIARSIHHHSGRDGAFIPINCSAIVETLLESELFGHEKGSFTGATARKAGKFEAAAGGTLFLDEIGEMAVGLQAKLLRVLQERSFVRVGGNESIHSSARIIAATNRDLQAMVEANSFREDLYFRLNVITLELPPLRERIDDLPPLVDHLLARIQHQVHKRITHISKDAWTMLKAYPWPGNIRELENVLTRAVILAPGDVLTRDLFGLAPPARETSAATSTATNSGPELVSLEELEHRQVKAILEYTHWNKGKSCEILGITRPTLDRKIGKYGLE
jgi:two-component system response regulator AtoC